MTSTEAGMIANLAVHYMPSPAFDLGGAESRYLYYDRAIRKVLIGFPALALEYGQRDEFSIIELMNRIQGC